MTYSSRSVPFRRQMPTSQENKVPDSQAEFNSEAGGFFEAELSE